MSTKPPVGDAWEIQALKLNEVLGAHGVSYNVAKDVIQAAFDAGVKEGQRK